MNQDILRRRSELSADKLLLLEKRLKGKHKPASEPQVIPRRNNEGPTPLSFAQQRLWFIDQMETGNPFYNVPVAVRLKGTLNVSALRKTFSEIIRRHESLRTNFVIVDGQPMQQINIAEPAQLPLLDLSDLGVKEREAEALRVNAAEVRKPFDLTSEPLLRTTLLRMAQDDHLVLVTMHHIVSDGWSVGVLVKEIAALYKAFSAGESSPLAELPIQYADYAVWQREWLTGEVLQSQLNYWKEQLEDVPPFLELPTDKARPAKQSHQGAFVSVGLGGELSEQINTLCQKEGVTLFMFLLAVFQTLLSRYSGQKDIVVGTPIAGRTQVEMESLIGFFVNTLALRSDLRGNPTFKEFLQNVREVVLGAYANQDIPFEKLVEEFAPERSLSHTPLIQVIITLQNAPQGDALEIPGLTISKAGVDTRTTKFDMSLGVTETTDGIKIVWDYSTDLFEEETMQRMLSHFQNLLQSICANTETRLQDLSLLSAEENHRLLFNAAPKALSPAVCLHHLFETHATRTPDAVALSCDGLHLSYGEINARANLLAQHLSRLGVGPESRVAVLFDHALDLMTAILGILKAGAAYVPLDPSSPQERLSVMLQDSGSHAIVTQQSLVEPWLQEQTQAALVLWHNLHTAEGEVMVSIDDRLLTSSSSGDNLTTDIAVTPQHAAYVIYTSDASGKPKGVVVTHENVWRLIEVTRADFGFDSSDVWTLSHLISSDLSVWEMWGAFVTGARLVVVPFWVSRAADAFHELLKEERVTVLSQTPSSFRQLMKFDEAMGAGGDLALRLVLFSGEALDPGILRRWIKRHGTTSPRLINLHGVTESTVHATYREITGDEKDGVSVIGAALGDMSVYVLDGLMQAVPEGVTGELYVGGSGVARGYLGRAEKTAERFVPDPYSKQTGARLYRTGDLARRRADGELEYLGCFDDQLKTRGYRIELEEIATALREQAEVKECEILAVADDGGVREKQIVAFVVPVEGASEVNTTALRSALAKKLPEYMLPTALVMLEAMPLKANGKVDKKKLLEADKGRRGVAVAYVAPRTPVEEIIAGIFSEVLNLERVGINDNFFTLGGHSLLVTLVVSRLREAFHVELPFRTVFDSPTVVDLSLAIAQSIIEKENETELLGDADQFSEAAAQLFSEEGLALTFAE